MAPKTNISVAQLLEKTARDSQNWDMQHFLDRQEARTLAFLNAHAVTSSRRNHDFADFLLMSEILLRDGIGVKMALAIFGYGKTENLNGTDLITRVLEHINDKKIALFGSSEETLTNTKEKLSQNNIKNIVLFEHGFHKDVYYLAKVQEHQPEVILLCMGMPRQEILAKNLRDDGYEGLIICGGGWADFYAGTKPRAPLWMRKYGMEWLFRLMNEPRRLGKRYTIDILYFFYVVLKDRYLTHRRAS